MQWVSFQDHAEKLKRDLRPVETLDAPSVGFAATSPVSRVRRRRANLLLTRIAGEVARCEYAS